MKLYATTFAAVIVFSLVSCNYGLGGGHSNYFEFDSALRTITGYDDDGPKNVTLPSTIDGLRVVAIGKNAFRGKQLTGVHILVSIATIGEGAFSNNLLTDATIGDSVVSIGASVFEDNRLETVVIPDSVITIGEKAFAGNQLRGIVIPGSVDIIGEDAFSGNPLTSITVGKNKNYASNIVPDFGTAYNGNGKQAGTYTWVNGSVWTKQ
jgi:hypothetical protein